MYISKKFWTGPFEQTPWARVKRSILKPRNNQHFTRALARNGDPSWFLGPNGWVCSKVYFFPWSFSFLQNKGPVLPAKFLPREYLCGSSFSIKPFYFEAHKCIRGCLQEEVFLFRVCKVFVTHEKFCMRILEQFSFLVAFSKTSQQRHGVPDRGIPGNPGIRECQSTSTTVQTPAPAMQQFVPSQKTSFYNVSLNPRPSNLSIRWDTPPWNEQQKFWKSMVRRWHLI